MKKSLRTLTRKVRDAIRRDMRWWKWADWAEEGEVSPYDMSQCPYWAHERIGYYHNVGPLSGADSSLHRRISELKSFDTTPCSCHDCAYGVHDDYDGLDMGVDL